MAKTVLSGAQKKFEDLNVIDNFLFNELERQEDTERAKEFVRILLETILQKKVTKIRLFSQFAEQGRDPGQHGVQMDSYVEACVGEGEDAETMIVPIKPEVFDIEPNTYHSDSEERRMRYYRALIDSKLLAAGVKYKDMKNVTLIMISNYDPFGYDRMMYTFRNTCEEEPDLEYDDGVRTIFLYTYGRKGAENKELMELLRYMADSSQRNVTNSNLETIQKMVEKIKENAEIGVRYMQSWEIRQISHDEGFDEGFDEGYDEGYGEGYGQGGRYGDSRRLTEDIANIRKNLGVDLPAACKALNITVEEYEKAQKIADSAKQ
ncbi:MAG: Rpn family recombination-promoting nuclease/putative transposase [Lachnospiraceae bacterium]|nr:Rpn family recombination-promoting nuclease/putative transposase [Lachnospiraceae bacterium]MBR1852942.1 Rpn family recombination-promoting nuclease/putative transposase [Lachnospiraceae bacterium]